MATYEKNALRHGAVSDQPEFGQPTRNIVDNPHLHSRAKRDGEKNMGIDNNIPDDLSVASTDMSISAILKGTSVAPLTVFERKAALINA